MDALTPPKPPSGKAAADGSTITSNLIGRSLVSKLSLAQKASNEKDAHDAANDLLSALTDLRMVISRRGLLRGDTSRAEAYLTKLTETSGNGGSGAGPKDGGGGKRRRKGGGGGGGKSNKAFNFIDGSPSHVGSGILDDEVLLLIGLGRILGAGKSAASANTLPDGVVQEAAKVLLAICRHVTTYWSSGSSCITAEYELLLVACPQLLSGLGNVASHLLENGSMDSLASCHRAAASIITLMGTRLSRSSATMEKIASTASDAIFYSGENTSNTKRGTCIHSAAAVLAAQPLAGNSDGTSPARLWTDSIVKETKSLTLVLSIFFPMHKSASKARQFVDSNDQVWVDLVDKSMASQKDRTSEFLRRIEGYSSILTSLLSLDGCDGSSNEGSISCASVPVGGLLDLIELMLAFPSAAEARYLSTKSKLRNISIEHGILSPSSAMSVANDVKSHGLTLFDRIVSSINSSGIVHGGRIMRLASNSLQSSCSYALKRSIDPVGTPALRADGKRGRRWLHDSLCLRMMSVRSFGNAMLRTGPSIALSSEGNIFAKSLVLVSGCLLEQTIAHDASPEADWGTLCDRIGLASECAKVLESALSVAGPYLDANTRSTIESVAGTCLSSLSGRSTTNAPGPTLSYSSTKCTLLKLASSCICAPWSDGAGSSLVGLLRRTAESLKRDTDGEVASAACSAICLCNAITVPRSPPMIVVSRSSGIDDGYTHMTQEGKPSRPAFTSSDILSGIEASRKEVQAAVITAQPTTESLVQGNDESGEKRKAEVSSKSADIAPKLNNERGPKKHKKNEISQSKSSEPEAVIVANTTTAEIDVEVATDEEKASKSKNAQLVDEKTPESMEVESNAGENDASSLDEKHAENNKEIVGTKASASERESNVKPSGAVPANSFPKAGDDDSDSDSLGEMPGIVMAGPDEDDI